MMLNVKEEIALALKNAVKELTGLDVEPKIEHSASEAHGDYASNVAMALYKEVSRREQKVSEVSPLRSAKQNFEGQAKVSKGERLSQQFSSPLELAEAITKSLISHLSPLRSSSFEGQATFNFIEKVEAVKPGFINFTLSKEYLITHLEGVLKSQEKVIMAPQSSSPQKIMVEYAHPNTHKEMHVGHMRTLITGESLARIFQAGGNKVFRANYQGDIGPHVAKALYGIQKLMEEKHLTLEGIEKWVNSEKAKFLGEGYVRGNQDYEDHKEEIDEINRKLYEKVSKGKREVSASEVSNGETPSDTFDTSDTFAASWYTSEVSKGDEENDNLNQLYKITRQWSLDYYDDFYKRFYTKFDRLFFESEVADCGKKIVEENVGKIFEKDQDAIVFKGEEYGLHTRVFVTKQGYPTYEGKDMCLGFKEYEAFPFDKNIHVVANEQAGYFKVIIKALELLDPQKFKDKEFHLSMGMVNIIGMKISSRTGEILRVDELIEKVKENVNKLIKEGKIAEENAQEVSDQIAIGAIKYSILKVGVSQNVEFDIEKSVSLEGNSGPYIQYTYARTRSVIKKSNAKDPNKKILKQVQDDKIETEELSLLRTIHHFSEVIGEAGKSYAPNLICNYLFDLAQKFNLFYQKHKIIGSEKEEFRLVLTDAAGKIIRDGLNLLGIMAPERM